VIRPDGVSVLGWPFRTATWYDSPGSRAHTCSDRYAKDLNTTLGSRGNTELRLGAGADVRAPIAGVVRFAGESRHNPGLGYRVVLESADVPGFFVFLAHLQPFERAALEGRRVSQGEVLPVRVGRSGGVRHAHLHLVAYRNVLSGTARERVLRGQSLAGYACGTDTFAAPFELHPE
jgi:murein DD-endopeptidase MepM/ murein hydrolase activator NlpD